MTTKQVTVTKYISCDGDEFGTRTECETHEREVLNSLKCQVWELLMKKRELLDSINKARIMARIAMLDAEKQKAEARSEMGKAKYHTKMSEYWRLTLEYNDKRRELRETRIKMRMFIDDLYMMYGLRKKKSSVARLERRKRSLTWRQEHTPDQWTTPNKIRVSKLPHPARGEDVS